MTNGIIQPDDIGGLYDIIVLTPAAMATPQSNQVRLPKPWHGALMAAIRRTVLCLSSWSNTRVPIEVRTKLQTLMWLYQEQIVGSATDAVVLTGDDIGGGFDYSVYRRSRHTTFSLPLENLFLTTSLRREGNLASDIDKQRILQVCQCRATKGQRKCANWQAILKQYTRSIAGIFPLAAANRGASENPGHGDAVTVYPSPFPTVGGPLRSSTN